MSEPAPATSRGLPEIVLRIAAALVLAPVVLAAVWFGGVAFAALVVLGAGLALWEWSALTGSAEPRRLRLAALLLPAAGLAALAAGAPLAGLLLVLVPAAAALARARVVGGHAWLAFGIVYIGLPAAALIVLRAGESAGRTAVLFVLLVVWATDIAAYFGGRAMGGPKLWPRVSPKKTWSGALSGLGAALAVAAAAAWLAGAAPAGALLPAALLSAATQAGDLFESAVKRRFGAKDSGALIPGHGGLLDRIDGLISAAPVAWLLAALGVGGPLLAGAGGLP